ncbi:MAG TPA: iron-sulfur cluster assembly accessory protein [Chloroflexota bacterium]|nr:iron-sulfur cluster assembly accessory protein [Chloroflexota bacterium]
MELTVSQTAVDALKQVITEHGELGAPANVRIGVQGACGCGNAHFGMALDEEHEGDTVVVVEGINFLVDGEALTYLDGAQLDYSDELMNRGFTVNRPNNGSGSGCGCGGHH